MCVGKQPAFLGDKMKRLICPNCEYEPLRVNEPWTRLTGSRIYFCPRCACDYPGDEKALKAWAEGQGLIQHLHKELAFGCYVLGLTAEEFLENYEVKLEYFDSESLKAWVSWFRARE